MATLRPQGRMIRVDIADDAGLAKLSNGAARLYFYLTPHLDSYGKFAGGPSTMRENVVPLLNWSEKQITSYLVEINNHTQMRIWRRGPRYFVHDVTWNDTQTSPTGQDGSG
jgi:hypothetical protein